MHHRRAYSSKGQLKCDLFIFSSQHSSPSCCVSFILWVQVFGTQTVRCGAVSAELNREELNAPNCSFRPSLLRVSLRRSAYHKHRAQTLLYGSHFYN